MYEEDRSPIKSSFNGNIAEIPEISVDNFEKKSKMAYFLSHWHSDHNKGLLGRDNATDLKRNGAKIYLSEKTKTILSQTHYNYDIIEDLVEPLKTGIVYNIDLPDGKAFEVTLIPVTHMVGAVMFLFNTQDKGNVLFTGDFLVKEDEIKNLTRLHDDKGAPIKISTMYVDATFDNKDYTYFPDRTVCHDQIVKKAVAWLDDDKHRLALFSTYQYGYDDVYSALYKKTKIKIFQMLERNKPDIHKIYQSLYGADNFMTNQNDSRIHICQNMSPTASHGNCGVSVAGRSGADYMHVHMSAARGCGYEPELHLALTPAGGEAYYLCYPTHCSKTQLDKFIEHFNAKNVRRFPSRPMTAPTAYTPYKNNQKRDRPADAEGSAKRQLFPGK